MSSEEKIIKEARRLVNVMKEALREFDELTQSQTPEMPKKRRNVKAEKFSDYNKMYAKKGIPV